MMKSKHLVEIDRVKQNVADAMEVKMQGQIAKQFRIFDDERAELYAQLKELEVVAGDYKKVKREYDMKMVFTKWLFIAKIRSIRCLAEIDQKAEAATEVEKQIADRELNLFLSKNPQLDLKVELEEAKSEIVDLCQKIGDISYEVFV